MFEIVCPAIFDVARKGEFVLGIFENNEDKKILFENSNCKIYQNYDKKNIFNEIKSIF